MARSSNSSSKPHKKATANVLLVGAPSAVLERRAHLLRTSGFTVTQAENVCYAEMFSEQQYFDAAVYDDSLVMEEQLSLAGVMRIRWPWMKLIQMHKQGRAGSPANTFDATVAAESELATSVQSRLL